MTVSQALREAAKQLQTAGIADAGPDAELLLRHVCQWDRARLIVSSEEPVPPVDAERFAALVSARATRRPLQHLTGTQAFWRHEFLVSPDVLIPRPESEILVQATLGTIARAAQPVVLDVGTGSGCLAISLAAARPEARILATDISPAALRVARQNAARIEVDARIDFREGDLIGPFAEERGRLHAVVSNPPYIDPTERPSLDPEVREHEPETALFAPGERYSIYRRLIPEAARHLRPGGWLVLEVGIGMADEVGRLCTEAGFEVLPFLLDLQSIPRVVLGSKRGSAVD